MFRITAATRITLGLVCSMLGILMAARYFALLPDEERLVTENRKQIVESLALTTAPLIEADDFARLEAVLGALVHRHQQLISMALRTPDGNLLLDTDGHSEYWPVNMGANSTERHMQITIAAKDQAEWGQLEVCFSPIRPTGVLGHFTSRMSQLLFFCAAFAFFTFRWFLTMVLKNLDPSQAVPRRVREALDILSEGLMIVGLNHRVLLANDAMETMTGYERNKLVGEKAGELKFRPVESADEDQLPWEAALSRGEAISNVMMELADVSGPPRIFRVNCSPLVGNDNENRGVMVTFDDVTVLEENKIQLRHARDDAEAANKAKSDFLANMSHEIRNPMNAIVGFTDILRRGMEKCEATRRDYLNMIHASGNHLVGLINDILDLSKIESGKMELELCSTNPFQLMNEVVNVLKMKADEADLSLDARVEGQIPAMIHSDPTRLRQILMNLVGNAVKFTETGGVKVVAQFVESAEGPQLRFEVVDTGIGMTEEQCGKIFEEFVQADSSVTRRFGGTGLGLAISKRLTEAFGGNIEVSSVAGEGTTFSFTVDTGEITDVEFVDHEQACERLVSVAGETQSGVEVRFKPARILVTDDTPANRQLVGLVLRNAGLHVEEAEHGQQAVERATAEDFDLMLMDMQMPVMDGFTATKTLRDQGLTTPIIALTANVMQSDRDRCAAAGCTEFLPKPIDIDKLLATLSEYLEVDDSPVVVSETKSLPVADSVVESVPAKLHEQDTNRQLDDVMKMVDNVLETTSQPTSSSPQPKLQSTLPTEIPEFREIVEQFIQMLPGLLCDVRDNWETRNFKELRELAHKLKGTGGTVGFSAFTEPAQRLQALAESQTEAGVEEVVQELERLSERIELPELVETPAV